LKTPLLNLGAAFFWQEHVWHEVVFGHTMNAVWTDTVGVIVEIPKAMGAESNITARRNPVAQLCFAQGRLRSI
ncbi:hypothetical protein, partial [Dickeya chrysanthemi]|uniref:hypothetical protein n=1 Tax=Dickeya chrysanthemi TaxID=556 RepID=UPI00057789CE